MAGLIWKFFNINFMLQFCLAGFKKMRIGLVKDKDYCNKFEAYLMGIWDLRSLQHAWKNSASGMELFWLHTLVIVGGNASHHIVSMVS